MRTPKVAVDAAPQETAFKAVGKMFRSPMVDGAGGRSQLDV
jgi:hypothetical protein